jgi:hypothetical protein
MKRKMIKLTNGNILVHSNGYVDKNSFNKYIRGKDIFANFIGIYLKIYTK